MKNYTCGRALMACALTAGIGLFSSAPAHAGIVQQFVLHDHPEGDQAPPAYGLRWDHLFGPGVASFSFDHPDAGMYLDVLDDGGALSIHIYGVAWGGLDLNGMYGEGPMAGLYDIDFTYNVNTSAVSDGWEVAPQGSGANENFGTIMSHGDGGDAFSMDIYDKMNMDGLSFAFRSDGHRLTGDDTSWVGRGWLTDNPERIDSSGAQDWLFRAEVVPAPSALAVLGLGLFGGRRRRRS
ncbi:MAG: hypothetical protein ACYTGR_01560 [Planctomycetota bacterium]|jgi:MYXO-CTERM domain-containing protein